MYYLSAPSPGRLNTGTTGRDTRPQPSSSGRVSSTEGGAVQAVDFATVYLKGGHSGGTTDEQGRYRLKTRPGDYTLVVSAIGYEPFEKPISLKRGEHLNLDITLTSKTQTLDEVTVVATGVNRVKRSAYNAVAVDTREMQNSTKNLSDALAKAPGMKLRESGGVGSDMQLMLDGFSGKHVKVFIDGVPQEGVGSSFGLNNIPISFADRIEIYKGVVPVGFGTDAIGGVINIVTNKQRRNWFLDAAYSYGSFNTHKSYLNFGQSFKSGLTYEINLFKTTPTTTTGSMPTTWSSGTPTGLQSSPTRYSGCVVSTTPTTTRPSWPRWV